MKRQRIGIHIFCTSCGDMDAAMRSEAELDRHKETIETILGKLHGRDITRLKKAFEAMHEVPDYPSRMLIIDNTIIGNLPRPFPRKKP